ncbi:hypothetical protein PIB30_019265 [Stylosanthes scabra]|uniref:Uncharacterized protein n=1 Tax=Stylosanthes scabra TaxID=79078 RepID=A0ABU6TA94_9FABA|nr:hypothetical protein [Stylosanthes scabra]
MTERTTVTGGEPEKMETAAGWETMSMVASGEGGEAAAGKGGTGKRTEAEHQFPQCTPVAVLERTIHSADME